MATILGTSGADDIVGTDDQDHIYMEDGGRDEVDGGRGDDFVYMGASLANNDQIDGGHGYDTVYLAGDYSAGLTLMAGTLINVEVLRFQQDYDYTITLEDSLLETGQSMTFIADATSDSDTLSFDGSAESDATLLIYGGGGHDTLIGGGGDDLIKIAYTGFASGVDTAKGRGGDDTFEARDGLVSDDQVNGGGGYDTLELNGDYSTGLTFNSRTVRNIEIITLHTDHDYFLTLDRRTVKDDGELTISRSPVSFGSGRMIIDGSAEKGCRLVMNGSTGDDILTGGGGKDHLDGGSGADALTGGRQKDILTGSAGGDILTGGVSNDTFVFNAVTESTVADPDQITDLEAGDIIYLGAIDADGDSSNGDTAFALVTLLTGVAGQASIRYNAADDLTRIRLDTNGDSVADSLIVILGDHSGHTAFVL